MFQPNILWRQGLGEVTKSSGITPVEAEDAEGPHCIPPLAANPSGRGWAGHYLPGLFFFPNRNTRSNHLCNSCFSFFFVEIMIYCSCYRLSEWGGWSDGQQLYSRYLVNTKHSLTPAVMGSILALPSLTVFCHSYRLSLWLSLWVSRVSYCVLCSAREIGVCTHFLWYSGS